jgi:hypothetical protein
MKFKALLIILVGTFSFIITAMAQAIELQEFEPLEKFAGGCPEGPPCSKTRGLLNLKPDRSSTEDSVTDKEVKTDLEQKTDAAIEPVAEKPVAEQKAGKKLEGKKKHPTK